jgi:hypothetical protein
MPIPVLTVKKLSSNEISVKSRRFGGVLTEIDTRCRTEFPQWLGVDYGELSLSVQSDKRQRRWNGKDIANSGIQGARLKGWRVGQIARRDPATHLQNGSRQRHSFLSHRSGGAIWPEPGCGMAHAEDAADGYIL